MPLAQAESLNVSVAGAGAPVVLIPGLFGSTYGFRKLAPLLTAAGYQTIIVEPLGIGSSSKPEHADYSLTRQAARVAAVLDTLGVRHALVIAHSAGGSLAYRLAYHRPDEVEGLISIEGGPAEAATTSGFRKAMRLAPWIKLFGGVKLVRRAIRKSLIASSGDSSWVTPEVVEAYTADAARNLDGTLKAFLAMASAREPERLRPHLGDIRCPLDLMVGTAPHDGDVGTDEILLLKRTLPRFTVDPVRGAGHFIQEEQPGAVLAAVERMRQRLTNPPGAH